MITRVIKIIREGLLEILGFIVTRVIRFIRVIRVIRFISVIRLRAIGPTVDF